MPTSTQPVQLRRPAGARLLRVGTLAKQTGKTVRALHLYEELGLLHPVRRTEGGFRLYAGEAKERIEWIGKLQSMGFSLAAIQEFVREWERSATAPDAMEKLRAIFTEKLAATRAEIAKLATLESDLRQSLAYLDSCRVCEPVYAPTECAHCSHHGHEHETAPALVAGIHQTTGHETHGTHGTTTTS